MGIYGTLSVAQQDGLEALIRLFEFARDGSDVAYAMWPTFEEKLAMIATTPDHRDISHFLVTLVRWSQEISVPWTLDLAVVCLLSHHTAVPIH